MTILGEIALNTSYDFDTSCEDAAADKNCVVVYPEDNELFIDIDNDNQLRIFEKRIKEIAPLLNGGVSVDKKPSSTPGHFHIIVRADGESFNEIERILFQAILGSDLVRETLSTFRHLRGDKNPTRLFRPVEK